MADTTTTDHDEIRRWVTERDGVPVTVEGTGGDGDAGVLRIDFPGYGDDEGLREISWEEWFEKFEEQGLAFVYQDTTSDGQVSRFNKIVSR